MERIVYRKTLDVHKNGIQFTLQGFETADNMARRIEISLMAGGDTIDFPLEQIAAMMYVTTPNATEPSINSCTIEDNKIIYDVLPIVEEGITEMQLKVIETSVEGATCVLASPKFAVEVTKSNLDDGSAEQTTTFTALEDAIAKARGVYESRLLRIELDADCMFRAYYADGTTYESDILKELFLKGDALISESYAKGGTGVRTGEDTDNSMYYSNVSKSASAEANRVSERASELLAEVTKQSVFTEFSVDFETGEVEYISPSYSFNINVITGELEATGEEYDADSVINTLVSTWLEKKTVEVDLAIERESKAREHGDTLLTQSLEAVKVDYIVEQGEAFVNGATWDYEKWASGKLVCNRVVLCEVSRANLGEWGTVYESPLFGGFEYPFSFVNIPIEHKSILSSGGYSFWLCSAGADNTNISSSNFCLCRASNINSDAIVPVKVAINVVGKWKKR